MRNLLRVLMALVFVSVCVVAFAQDAEQSEVGKTIDWIWATIMKLLGLGIVALTGIVLAKLKSKFGIELNEKQEAMIKDKAMDVVSLVEERAAKAFKLDQIITSAEDKLNQAVEKLTDKIPFLNAETAKDVIEAVLPKFRAVVGERVEAIGN